jgi:hypothetical protein
MLWPFYTPDLSLDELPWEKRDRHVCKMVFVLDGKVIEEGTRGTGDNVNLSSKLKEYF